MTIHRIEYVNDKFRLDGKELDVLAMSQELFPDMRDSIFAKQEIKFYPSDDLILDDSIGMMVDLVGDSATLFNHNPSKDDHKRMAVHLSRGQHKNFSGWIKSYKSKYVYVKFIGEQYIRRSIPQASRSKQS